LSTRAPHPPYRRHRRDRTGRRTKPGPSRSIIGSWPPYCLNVGQRPPVDLTSASSAPHDLRHTFWAGLTTPAPGRVIEELIGVCAGGASSGGARVHPPAGMVRVVPNALHPERFGPSPVRGRASASAGRSHAPPRSGAPTPGYRAASTPRRPRHGAVAFHPVLSRHNQGGRRGQYLSGGRPVVRRPAASAVRHADGRPSNWSGGHPVSRRPVSTRPVRSGCPDRQTSGVRRRCSRAVRTALDRRRRRCGGTGDGWRTGLDVSLWSASGLVVAARIGPGGEGMVERWQCAARTRVDARPGPPFRMRTGCGAVLAAWPTMGAGPAPGCRSVAGEQGRSGCSKSPAGAAWAGCRRTGRPWAGPGGVTTLRGRCAGVGPLSSAAGGPIRLSGE
jgi:hypothetical protein